MLTGPGLKTYDSCILTPPDEMLWGSQKLVHCLVPFWLVLRNSIRSGRTITIKFVSTKRFARTTLNYKPLHIQELKKLQEEFVAVLVIPVQFAKELDHHIDIFLPAQKQRMTWGNIYKTKEHILWNAQF